MSKGSSPVRISPYLKRLFLLTSFFFENKVPQKKKKKKKKISAGAHELGYYSTRASILQSY